MINLTEGAASRAFGVKKTLLRACTGALLLSLFGLGAVAEANDSGGTTFAYHQARNYDDHQHSRKHHERPDKGKGYNRHSDYVYGKVIHTRPLYEMRISSVPAQSCYQEQVTYRSSDSSTGTILGGIIGAAVGHELGHEKRNKQVGAIAGAVLGSSIGHDISRRNGGQVHGTQQRCDTVYEERRERVLIGYGVKYRYDGRVYKTQLDYDPGEYIKLKQDLRPAY